MNGQFLQLGQHMLPTDNIHSIDQNYPAGGTGGGGGTIVRIWLRTGGQGLNQFSLPGTSAPSYLDFRGTEAQRIRQWCSSSARIGNVTVVLAPAGGTGEGTDTGTPPTPKAHRGRKAKAKTTAATATA